MDVETSTVFNAEEQLQQTLQLLLREDHTKIVDDTLYEKILDWLLRCIRSSARSSTQNCTSIAETFWNYPDSVQLLQKGLIHSEERVVAVVLRFCGHLAGTNEKSFARLTSADLDALSLALKLTKHTSPRIRVASFECLCTATSVHSPIFNGNGIKCAQACIQRATVLPKHQVPPSVPWLQEREKMVFGCLASALSDRSIYVTLKGRQFLVQVLNIFYYTLHKIPNLWVEGSPVFEEITRVLSDAPTFSYERKKAIADLVVCVCMAATNTNKAVINGTSSMNDKLCDGLGCIAFLEVSQLPRLMWEAFSVDCDVRLRMLALDVVSLCFDLIQDDRLAPFVIVPPRFGVEATTKKNDNTGTSTAGSNEKTLHRGKDCPRVDARVSDFECDELASTLMLKMLPTCIAEPHLMYLPVCVAALQTSIGNGSDPCRQLLRCVSEVMCAVFSASDDSTTTVDSPCVLPVHVVRKSCERDAKFRNWGTQCDEWLRIFEGALRQHEFKAGVRTCGMTPDKKVVASVVCSLIQHWCPIINTQHSAQILALKHRTQSNGSSGVAAPLQWQQRLTSCLISSISIKRNPMRLTVRHRRYILRAASTVVASCHADINIVKSICMSILWLLDDPGLDTTLIKDALSVTLAWVLRDCTDTGQAKEGKPNEAISTSNIHSPDDNNYLGNYFEIVEVWGRLLFDPRWEVRDSVVETFHTSVNTVAVEYPTSQLQTSEYTLDKPSHIGIPLRQSEVHQSEECVFGNAVSHEQTTYRHEGFIRALSNSSLVEGVWRACRDGDAYVRSSSIRAMFDLMQFPPTRIILEKTLKLPNSSPHVDENTSLLLGSSNEERLCQTQSFAVMVSSICELAQCLLQTDPEAFCRRAAIELLDNILRCYACCCESQLSVLAECLYRAAEADPDSDVRVRALHLLLSLTPTPSKSTSVAVTHPRTIVLAGSNHVHEACVEFRVRLFILARGAFLVKRITSEEPGVRRAVCSQLSELMVVFNNNGIPSQPVSHLVIDRDKSVRANINLQLNNEISDFIEWLSDGSCASMVNVELERESKRAMDHDSPLVIFAPLLDAEENTLDCYN
eukprot:CFRG8607T1